MVLAFLLSSCHKCPEAQLGKVARYLARSRGIKIPGAGYRTQVQFRTNCHAFPVLAHVAGSCYRMQRSQCILRADGVRIWCAGFKSQLLAVSLFASCLSDVMCSSLCMFLQSMSSCMLVTNPMHSFFQKNALDIYCFQCILYL